MVYYGIGGELDDDREYGYVHATVAAAGEHADLHMGVLQRGHGPGGERDEWILEYVHDGSGGRHDGASGGDGDAGGWGDGGWVERHGGAGVLRNAERGHGHEEQYRVVGERKEARGFA